MEWTLPPRPRPSATLGDGTTLVGGGRRNEDDTLRETLELGVREIIYSINNSDGISAPRAYKYKILRAIILY